MKRVVVLTGSGISAESGLKTFRDSGGLWEGFRVEEVASPEGFAANPRRVLDFYNQRRRQAQEAEPNPAHLALAKLEEAFDVQVITQNVDDLHERAGSSSVIHLHGQLRLGRSVRDPECVVEVEGDIEWGDLAPDGEQLRPHIVWFGESVPKMMEAAQLAATAEIFLIVGTSLSVYPASGLVDFVPEDSPIFIVDPVKPAMALQRKIYFVEDKASIGLPFVVEELLKAARGKDENSPEDSQDLP